MLSCGKASTNSPRLIGYCVRNPKRVQVRTNKEYGSMRQMTWVLDGSHVSSLSLSTSREPDSRSRCVTGGRETSSGWDEWVLLALCGFAICLSTTCEFEPLQPTVARIKDGRLIISCGMNNSSKGLRNEVMAECSSPLFTYACIKLLCINRGYSSPLHISNQARITRFSSRANIPFTSDNSALFCCCNTVRQRPLKY